ncbi:MAG: hypothetical protein Q8N43_01220 [Candidatus Azambacteria bacterium]|nr:hypothetical protein [Candidatus Azambacteria bacterium]
MTKQKIILNLVILLAMSCLLFATPVFARGLIPCGGPGEDMCTVCDFYKLIQNIITLLLEIFASLATLAAIYIAFLFMFSGGSPAKITDAKSKLWLVIIGIFWVLGSWLVLNTILNFMVDKSVFPWPWNTINCSVSKPSISSSTSGGRGTSTSSFDGFGGGQFGGGGAGGVWGGLTEQEARNQLQQAGIIVNKDSCPIGVSYQKVSGGCTSLDGVNASTIEGAIRLKNGCKCVLEITGGTELGHTEGATASHASGNKLDFSPNSVLDRYIQTNFTSLDPVKINGVLYSRYQGPNGAIYTREGDHWDVKF